MPKWGMLVDLDRCSGCRACVAACQIENNVPINTEEIVNQRRGIQWIRIERYWEGTEYPAAKVRNGAMLCQHCRNAPCEPVCPVYATYHNSEGLNTQIYNRCIGTRYCANNDPYNVRFFNYWEPQWPESYYHYLNPDVTVRSKGVMEKCTFCVQRIRRTERQAKREGRALKDGDVQPACVQACPTDALVFGDISDTGSRVSRLAQDKRHFRVLESLGTDPVVFYLKKVDPQHVGDAAKQPAAH
ncbi:MAG: 4Fe-4S dicluster domain-containing protein [Chloroflexi bacterium]|nr:4Fe-4S dicluster domain-containing protein [Chloroflexota bacterium]